MAFLNLEDRRGSVEVVVFADTYQNSLHLLDGEDPVLVVGTVQQEEKGPKLIAQRILSLIEAKESLTQAIHVTLPLDKLSKENLQDLKAILERHKGECKVYVHLSPETKCEAVIRLDDRLRVKPGRALIEEVNRYFGSEVVSAVLTNGPAALKGPGANSGNLRRTASN